MKLDYPKSCKTTFNAHLLRIWTLTRFTRFIRKVFATKILLSGKFSLFVTLGRCAKFAEEYCAGAGWKVLWRAPLCCRQIWTYRAGGYHSQIQNQFVIHFLLSDTALCAPVQIWGDSRAAGDQLFSPSIFYVFIIFGSYGQYLTFYHFWFSNFGYPWGNRILWQLYNRKINQGDPGDCCGCAPSGW